MSSESIKETFTKIVQINGVITIPHEIRKLHSIEMGDYVTVTLVKVDKGEGLGIDEVEGTRE